MANASGQGVDATLDQQYDFYLGTLSRRCQNMNFAVDDNLVLLPGQAGPQLAAFCSGPPPVGGISTSNAQGGSSGATSGTRSAAEDAALRRRREQLRERAKGETAPKENDLSLFESGKASVFLSADYRYEKQQQTRFEAEHRSDLFSGTLGADYRFGTTAVAGAALKFEDLSGDFTRNGGDFQSRGQGAVLYGSWLPRADLFVDANVGAMRRDLDTRRIVGIQRVTLASPGAPPIISFAPPLAAVVSGTDGHETTAEIRSGYDAVAGRVT